MFGKKNGYDVFLGGTKDSNWRDDFIKKMHLKNSRIKCYNPIVENWTTECIELENLVKQHSRYHVYVITPNMSGVYSIAELIDSVHDHSKKVYFYIEQSDISNLSLVKIWSIPQRNSLNAVSNLVKQHGGKVASSMEELVEMIAEDYKSISNVRNSIK